MASVFFISVFFLLQLANAFSSSSSLDICKSRPYPELCFSSIKHSKSTDDISESVLLQILRLASSESGKLSGILFRGEPSMVQQLKGTMQDCMELHGITVSLLKKCIAISGDISNPRKLADIRSYLSAVVTNRESCLENLDSASGPSKPAILSSMDLINKHVRNALSILGEKSGAEEEKKARRLTGNINYPSWISEEDRRILEGSGSEFDGATVLTVAADGSGNFTRISDAISFAPNDSIHGTIIRVKKGTYEENLDISAVKVKIALIGDGSSETIITGKRSVSDGWTTQRTATLGVTGDGFLARDITIQNTAGPENKQAVALRVHADLSALYRCTIKGFQDTLYVHARRQFYRECDIYGTVDYIFGDAQVVIQASNIISRLPLPGQFIAIAAQSRTSPEETTGISIHNCSIIPAMELKNAAGKVMSYLGRPWKEYARTVFMDSYIDEFISPEGWKAWNETQGLDLVYYAEYQNRGPGSNITGRVNATGVHIMDYNEALTFSVTEFISGDTWLGPTQIPYDRGV